MIISDVDAALVREAALTEPGCEQRPTTTDAEIEAIVEEELLNALLVDCPATYRARFGAHRRPRAGAWEADHDA